MSYQEHIQPIDITVEIDLEHLAEIVLSGFLSEKLLISPPFCTLVVVVVVFA